MDASEMSDREQPEGATEGVAGVKGLRSMRRLRDRVAAAAQELAQLRQENAALEQRISELEAGGRVLGDGGVAIPLEGDPEVLRRKVDGFIQAIDRFLEEDRRRE